MWKLGSAFCSLENHAKDNPALCFMPLISVIHGYQFQRDCHGYSPAPFIKGSCVRLAGAAALLLRC